MKNYKLFSVLFLIGQSGYIVARDSADFFSLFTSKAEKERKAWQSFSSAYDAELKEEEFLNKTTVNVDREQLERALQRAEFLIAKNREQEKVAQELAAKKAKEEAAPQAKEAATVALQQAPANETMLTQAIHAVQNAANQALEKTEDTVFKIWVVYKVGTSLQTQEAARNPEKAKEEAARLARKLDNSSNAFVS